MRDCGEENCKEGEDGGMSGECDALLVMERW